MRNIPRFWLELVRVAPPTDGDDDEHDEHGGQVVAHTPSSSCTGSNVDAHVSPPAMGVE